MGTELSCYVSYIIIYNEKKYLINLCSILPSACFADRDLSRTRQHHSAPFVPLSHMCLPGRYEY